MFVDGELYAYTYESPSSYEKSLEIWNKDSFPFYIGVVDQGGWDNIFYLKGLVYSTRLYTKSLTPDEVKLNYDMTLKYRDSFKNE